MEWLTLALVLITGWYAISTQLMLREMKRQRESAQEELEVIKRNLWISIKVAEVSTHTALTGSGTPDVRHAAFKRLHELVPELEDLGLNLPPLKQHSKTSRVGHDELKLTGQQPTVHTTDEST